MKKFSLILTIFFISCSLSQGHAQDGGIFYLSSNNIIPDSKISNKHVFNGFGCSGKNFSPNLFWKNANKQAKSFAITVYDPDAPTGSGWWHWVLVNIPTNYASLPINFGEKNQFNLENGINQIRNDFGNYSFGGPCPPKGDSPHRYIFTIYALRVEKLQLQEGATAAMAGFMVNQAAIGKASFVAYFGR